MKYHLSQSQKLYQHAQESTGKLWGQLSNLYDHPHCPHYFLQRFQFQPAEFKSTTQGLIISKTNTKLWRNACKRAIKIYMHLYSLLWWRCVKIILVIFEAWFQAFIQLQSIQMITIKMITHVLQRSKIWKQIHTQKFNFFSPRLFIYFRQVPNSILLTNYE